MVILKTFKIPGYKKYIEFLDQHRKAFLSQRILVSQLFRQVGVRDAKYCLPNNSLPRTYLPLCQLPSAVPHVARQFVMIAAPDRVSFLSGKRC
jgi:hypothetical protein